MSVDLSSLKDFIRTLSLLEVMPLNNKVFLQYQNCCIQIISDCKTSFPEECGQIDLILQMVKAKIISAQHGFYITQKIVTGMVEQWDSRAKPKKIFISHATDDKKIIDKLVALLEKLGVKKQQLFCSSIPGYGIPQGSGDIYQYLRNEMSNDNLFVIMMLSKNYYSSPACLNEMGAAWIKQSTYQSILLPGFDYPDIQGAINPRDMSFRLSDRENRAVALNEFKDRIVAHLELEPVDYSIWERFRNSFITEVDQIASESEANKQ